MKGCHTEVGNHQPAADVPLMHANKIHEDKLPVRRNLYVMHGSSSTNHQMQQSTERHANRPLTVRQGACQSTLEPAAAVQTHLAGVQLRAGGLRLCSFFSILQRQQGEVCGVMPVQCSPFRGAGRNGANVL